MGRQVVEGLLRMRGQHHKGDRVRAELPEVIDTDVHGEWLARLGVWPRDLRGLDNP